MATNFTVSFVLPMFNEEDNIATTLKEIKLVAEEIASDYEIIVVDDGSTDGCGDIVRDSAKNDKRIKLFSLEKNTKFGGALAEGFKKASKDVILYVDSDMPVEVEDIHKSISLLSDADIITGYSRIKKGETIIRQIISKVYNFMVETLFGLRIKDINSGYKIIKRYIVKDIEFISRSPFVDVELFIYAKKKNCKILQFPLVFRPRASGKSHIARFSVILATFIDMLKVKFCLCNKEYIISADEHRLRDTR